MWRTVREHIVLAPALLTTLLCGMCSCALAQQSPADDRERVREDHWEIAIGGGFLMPHRASIRSMIHRHAHMAHVHWSTAAGGLWSCSRENARWGATLRTGTTGAPDHIGPQVALLGTADLRLSAGWQIRLGGGWGWTSKVWGVDSANERQRVVIGSPINAAIQLGVHRPARQGAGVPWHQRVGVHVTLDHQSNASFTQPNLGTNVVSLAASIGWPHTVRRPLRSEDTLAVIAVLPAPVEGIRLHAATGRRQPAPLASRETVAEVGMDWRFGGRLRMGYVAGSMVFVRPDAIGIGTHAGFQIRFTRVHIDLVHGRYLRRWQPEEGHYNRVVLHAHWRDGWWFNLGLLTHGFRAHHPALGVGYVPGGRHPYGRRHR